MSPAKAGDFFLHYIYGCKKVVKIELYAIETLKSVDLLAVMRSGVRSPYAPPISSLVELYQIGSFQAVSIADIELDNNIAI